MEDQLEEAALGEVPKIRRRRTLSVRVTIITIYHCITKYQLQCFLLLHPYFFSNKPVCSAPLFYSVSESGGVTFGSRLSQGCTY